MLAKKLKLSDLLEKHPNNRQMLIFQKNYPPVRSLILLRKPTQKSGKMREYIHKYIKSYKEEGSKNSTAHFDGLGRSVLRFSSSF